MKEQRLNIFGDVSFDLQLMDCIKQRHRLIDLKIERKPFFLVLYLLHLLFYLFIFIKLDAFSFFLFPAWIQSPRFYSIVFSGKEEKNPPEYTKIHCGIKHAVRITAETHRPHFTSIFRFINYELL
uniref:Uncharacterized protein n=1 Tax=Gasterosteus aculeatus TaxID=69293 RepID=G3P5F6_GASAC